MQARQKAILSAPEALHQQLALFLDVDGTLIEFASEPQMAAVPEQLVALLRSLQQRLEGAVALVSGRHIEEIDRLFAPLILPVSGLHGLERRDASGAYHRAPVPQNSRYETVRRELERFAASHAGLVWEDKRWGFAIHYRGAPQLAPTVIRETKRLAAGLVPEYELLAGAMVMELRPASSTKGSAVGAFLQEPPFAGRRPVYAGDDVTDETAFEAVNAREGVSILVGAREPTAAMHRLTDVSAMHRWLAAGCIGTGR